MNTFNPQIVTVRVPGSLKSAEEANQILKNVLDKLGCGGCFSGYDIRFTNVRDLTVDKTFNVHELGL